MRAKAGPAISSLTAPGHVMYSASVAALGGLLLSHTFVYVWAPLHDCVPWRDGLTRAYGTAMLLSALGLSWRKTVSASSLLVTSLFLGWLLLVQLPCIVTAPSTELLWSGAAQIVAVVAGSFILFASSPSTIALPEGSQRWFRGARAVRTTRSVYAMALAYFGVHHFFNVAAGAEAVPAWLPFRLAWVCVTGVGHVAAGVAILTGVAARPAAILEAIMITAFVVLVHVPGVVGAPRDALQWSMLVDASAIGGAAWIVARSYRHPPATPA